MTSLKKCQLQSKNLDKLTFINQNWPNDPRVLYMNSTSMDFIEKDEIVKELKEFEREKIVDMNFLKLKQIIFHYLIIYLVHHLL